MTAYRLRELSQGHDRRPRGRPMRLWRRVAISAAYPRHDRGFGYGLAIDVIWPVLAAVARWDFRGGRHVPERGGAVLAVNHLSHVDPIVLVAYCLAQGRVPRFLAMQELWSRPIVGAPLRGGRHVPVDRAGSGVAAYRAAVQAVRAGELVVIYPEGGFAAESDGWPRAARSGVARIALETGAPVIPVAQWGSQDLMPPEGAHLALRPRPTLRVLAGAPVALDDLRPDPGERFRASVLRAATDRIMGRITDQLAVLRDATPPAAPAAPPPETAVAQPAGVADPDAPTA